MRSKKLSRRTFLKGSASAGLGLVAGGALLAESARAIDKILPPMGSERILSTGDSEGLINVHISGGDILRVTSLDAPSLQASPMALNYHRRVFAPDRILYPMKRVDWEPGGRGDKATRGQPRYVRLGWDEALDIVASELKRVKDTYGNEAIFAESIAGWTTMAVFNNKGSQFGRFFGMFGGWTRSLGNKSYACWQWAAPYSLGTVFTPHSRADVLQNSNMVIFWGCDPMKCSWAASSADQGSLLRDWAVGLRQRGKRIVDIDPLFTETSRLADQHISIRPNTDSAMMAAMAYVMISEDLYDKDFISTYTVGFDPFKAYILGETDGTPKTPEWAAAITEVPAETITALAREFATTPKAFLCPGFASQRQDHGEQQVRMIITLAAMKGEIGLPGGGVGTFNVTWAGGGHRVTQRGPAGFPGVANPVTQTFIEQRWADQILNPGLTLNQNGKAYPYPEPGKSEVKLIYWPGGSSLTQHEDVNKDIQAMRKMETIIVQDCWWTSAARFADIVLPAATLFERDDIFQTGNYVVFQHKMIEPLGEARTDHQIFSDLALRLGFKEQFTEGLNSEDWLRRQYATSEIPLSYEQFKEQGFYELAVDTTPYVSFSEFRKDPFANPLKTASGLIEIHSATIEGYGYADCPGTPQYMEPFEWLGSEKAKTYPLHLITMHPRWRRHSSYDNVDTLHGDSKVNGFEPVFINTQDAAARGIKSGDVVRVFNDRGQLLAGALVTDDMRKDVVIVQEGSWYAPADWGAVGTLDRGGCANMLTNQVGTSQLAQGPASHTGLVQVEKYNLPVKPNDYAAIAPMGQQSEGS